MAFSCSRCVGLIVLIVALLACTVSFVAPYWITRGAYNEGLLGFCSGDLDPSSLGDAIENKCTWFSDFDFQWEKSKHDWLYACQAMFAFGLLLLFVAVPCACVSVCCDTYGNVGRTTGSLLIIAAVFMTIAIIVYGVFVDSELGVTPFYNTRAGKFNWGYYMGIGGVILDYIVGGLFLCSHEKY